MHGNVLLSLTCKLPSKIPLHAVITMRRNAVFSLMQRARFLLLLTFINSHVLAQERLTNPGKRVDAKMFYHHQLRKVVMIDGTPPYIEQPVMTTIWAWDGKQWQSIHTHEEQPARYASGAAYDAGRNVVVSFGGRVGKEERIARDTWEWDGVRWTQHPDTTIQARDHLSLGYDERRGKTILFGGGIFPRVPGPWATDTWEWNGRRWEQIGTTGPVGRVTTMIYDAAREEIVLFGGVGAPANGVQPKFSDTWVWQGRQWRKAADAGPPPRSRHTLAFDSKNRKVVLYGGENDNGPLADMWEWNGKAWKEVKFKGPSPGDRYVHSMAYDSHRNVLVLFGGMHQKQLMSDTWEWNGEAWSQVD